MKMRLVSLIVGVLLGLVVMSAGCSGGAVRNTATTLTGSPSGDSAGSAPVAPRTQTDNAPATAGSESAKSGSATTDRLVVTNASMQLRVSDLSATIASVRSLTLTAGGSVSQLSVSSNSEVTPETKSSTSGTAPIAGPASASLTLRIPAEKLSDVESRVSKLGALISQSSNESDVTQQHIDLAARLANSRAEEARLRSLLSRAGNVTDLLQVERELSRVQGDIESMQAQLSYLEGQAAMATLTITLEQPGPVVRPSAASWGFLGAITTGLQGALILINTLVTTLLAVSPLIVIGLLIWWLVVLLVRRHRRKRASAQPAEELPEPPTPTE